jgi:hypothetical protein
LHLKFNISDTHIWWKGSSRLNSNSTFQNDFPLGSPYFITCFPCWSIVFLPYDYPLGSSYVYHMISLLGLLYSNHTIFLLDTRIFTTWFPSWILLFFPHDFLLESLYFYHIIFLLGSSYFYHMISLLQEGNHVVIIRGSIKEIMW